MEGRFQKKGDAAFSARRPSIMVETASRAWRRRPGLEIHVKSDAELVAEVLRGEIASFEVLVERYQRTVMGTALAVLGDFHAAQDAAQDAFILAYRKLGTLRDGASFAPWMLRLARRRAVELSRRQAKRRPGTLPPDLAHVSSDGQLDDVTKEVFAAVDRLPVSVPGRSFLQLAT